MMSNIHVNRFRRGAVGGAACLIVCGAALLTGCDESANRQPPPAPAPANSGAPSNTPSGAHTPAPAPSGHDANAAASADARILSILHVKNAEEIEAGKLAQSNGGSQAVKDYGKTLETDHTAADKDVTKAASDAGVTLMSADEVKAVMARDNGQAAGADPLADLRSLKGAEFDAAFAQRMHQGHAEVIAMVEKAQGEAQSQPVKDLLAKVLPVLRDHQTKAQTLDHGGAATPPGTSPTTPPANPNTPPSTPPATPPPGGG